MFAVYTGLGDRLIIECRQAIGSTVLRYQVTLPACLTQPTATLSTLSATDTGLNLERFDRTHNFLRSY